VLYYAIPVRIFEEGWGLTAAYLNLLCMAIALVSFVCCFKLWGNAPYSAMERLVFVSIKATSSWDPKLRIERQVRAQERRIMQAKDNAIAQKWQGSSSGAVHTPHHC